MYVCFEFYDLYAMRYHLIEMKFISDIIEYCNHQSADNVK